MPTERTKCDQASAAKAWCDAVIQVNTKYGTMNNKRFLPNSQVPLSAWKKVVDAAVAGVTLALEREGGVLVKAGATGLEPELYSAIRRRTEPRR